MLTVENFKEDPHFSLRGWWAYNKLSQDPDTLLEWEKEEAFRQYITTLKGTSFQLHSLELKNFIKWHWAMYTKQPIFVYVFLDTIEKDHKNHIPLYVGMTMNLEARFQQHSEKSWFPKSKKLALEIYADHWEARSREKYLINELVPLFNKQGGIGMDWRNEAIEKMQIMVPKMNDVSNLSFSPVGDSVERYSKHYGAKTHHYSHEDIRANRDIDKHLREKTDVEY